jgi:hypothetical protein
MPLSHIKMVLKQKDGALITMTPELRLVLDAWVSAREDIEAQDRKRVKQEKLEQARAHAADHAFSNTDLPEIKDYNRGWDRDGNHWHKTVYWEEEKGGDSIRGSFDVEFAPNSADILTVDHE